MQRFLFASFMVAMISPIAIAADGDSKLDGSWILATLERDGKNDDSMVGAVREQTGDKYTLTPKNGKAIGGTMTVDSSKKTFDMKPAEGRYQGKTLLGIYKLEGDTLTMAFAEPGKDRPKAFKGEGVVVSTYTKGK